ncbi:hypothetical protein T09_8776 [Trichinella sp. T9]|nr:hypothetical protein T09_8776 [Trichinella sp. T9]
MGTVRTFFCISRERRNRELPIEDHRFHFGFQSVPRKLQNYMRLLYYKNAFQVQMQLRSRTLPGGNKPITVKRFLQYLGKYTFMKRATRFWKDLRQTNAYVSNKWLLKLPCAYLNTQGSGPFENPLKRIDDG